MRARKSRRLSAAAWLVVPGTSLATVTATSGSVSVSSWSDLHYVLFSITLCSLFFLYAERTEDFLPRGDRTNPPSTRYHDFGLRLTRVPAGTGSK